MGNEHPLLQQIAHHEQHRSVEISPTSKCLKHPYNKTDSLHLKIGHPKRESSLPFSGAMLVLGGVTWLAIEWRHLEGEDSSMSYSTGRSSQLSAGCSLKKNRMFSYVKTPHGWLDFGNLRNGYPNWCALETATLFKQDFFLGVYVKFQKTQSGLSE